MANYDWSCQVCDNTVSAGHDSCKTCGSPSSMNEMRSHHVETIGRPNSKQNLGAAISA